MGPRPASLGGHVSSYFCLLACLLPLATAYPVFWVNNYLDAGPTLGCIAHPTATTLTKGHGVPANIPK